MQREKIKEIKSLLFTLDNLHSKETAIIPRNSYNFLMGGCNGNKIVGLNNIRRNDCELGGSGWT